MARYRFPGKALKLANKKRTKFSNWSNEDTHTEKIVRGFELFKDLFGSSEEVSSIIIHGFHNICYFLMAQSCRHSPSFIFC